ncbi:MAG TPA: hypothetical protein VMW70_13845 [Burkholderiales bacterium]|nr:hypothetical protein [Burkholderiales bacterium]
MSNNLTFLGRIMTALERSAQQRTQAYLLGLSDGYLEDMGLSRQLLKQGPEAWPWRKAEDPLPVPGLSAAMREVNTQNAGQPRNLEHGFRGVEQAVGFNTSDAETKLAA